MTAGMTLAGLSSKVAQDDINGVLGTEAIIRESPTLAGPRNITMAWRSRTTGEKVPTADLNLFAKGGSLASDVVKLEGIQAGDVYAMQMSYTDHAWGPSSVSTSWLAAGCSSAT